MNRIPAQNHSTTSIAAAEKIFTRTEKLRQEVLQYLRGFPDGLTDDAMQDGLKMDGNTQRPRRQELVERKLVKDSGRKGLSRRGNPAVIWVTT